MERTITATPQVVQDYQRLFVNRRAYTMQSLRPHLESGRHYYFRPSKKGTDIPLMLTEETIRQHLEGEITVGSGDFGNAIRGPLGIHRGANRRFWFYGADYTLEARIEYLNGLMKVTEEELRKFIAGKELPGSEVPTRTARNVAMGRPSRNGRSEFHILDHVGKVRKAGRNYVARCPACADSGHDRSGDNLAILIEDPRFYKCWAGCTREMIRAALGHPVRARHSA